MMSYLSLDGAWFVHAHSGHYTGSTHPPVPDSTQSVFEPPDD